MHAAAVRFELFVPESRSLKTKRGAIRPIVDALRHRLHVSVAEVDHQDTWQRAAIAVAVVAESDHQLRAVLASVDRLVANAAGVELLEAETAWLDPDPAPLGEG
jgi:uncharacterized protein YlxP (DUF503 family)